MEAIHIFLDDIFYPYMDEINKQNIENGFDDKYKLTNFDEKHIPTLKVFIKKNTSLLLEKIYYRVIYKAFISTAFKEIINKQKQSLNSIFFKFFICSIRNIP